MVEGGDQGMEEKEGSEKSMVVFQNVVVGLEITHRGFKNPLPFFLKCCFRPYENAYGPNEFLRRPTQRFSKTPINFSHLNAVCRMNFGGVRRSNAILKK